MLETLFFIQSWISNSDKAPHSTYGQGDISDSVISWHLPNHDKAPYAPLL